MEWPKDGLDETPEEAATAILVALHYLAQEARRAGLVELANVIQSAVYGAECSIDGEMEPH